MTSSYLTARPSGKEMQWYANGSKRTKADSPGALLDNMAYWRKVLDSRTISDPIIIISFVSYGKNTVFCINSQQLTQQHANFCASRGVLCSKGFRKSRNSLFPPKCRRLGREASGSTQCKICFWPRGEDYSTMDWMIAIDRQLR